MARPARGAVGDSLEAAWAWYRMRWPGHPVDHGWKGGAWVGYADTYAMLDRTVPDAEERIGRLREFLIAELGSSPPLVDGWMARQREAAAEWDVRRDWSRGKMPPSYDERILKPLRAV